MRSRLHIVVVACTVVLAALFLAGLVQARTFSNEDAAKDRQDAVWGTRMNHGQPYFGTDEDENTVWGYRPAPEEEEEDWYDKVIITVDPNMDWPRDDVAPDQSAPAGDEAPQ